LRNLILLVAFALAAGIVTLAVGCGKAGTSGMSDSARTKPLSGIQPETRRTIELVMDKVGRHYQVLELTVEKGNFLEAATHADAIAALGSFLAPHRDPGMPETYIAMQAALDEAARELAAAARLGKAHEVTQLFNEIQGTCRNCHGEFRVKLKSPYRELGWTKQENQALSEE